MLSTAAVTSLFGSPRLVEAQRALCEFQCGRPVLVECTRDRVLALPVDGLTNRHLASFAEFVAPRAPRLVLTARRARAIGMSAATAMSMSLTERDTAASVFALAAAVDPPRAGSGEPAGVASVAALQLAKMAHRLPALVVAGGISAEKARDASIARVEASAIAELRRDLVQSLTIAAEAKVPLQDVGATRFLVFRDAIGKTSTAIIVGEPDFDEPVRVRMHSACLTGDVFGSRRCDCGDQLQLALLDIKKKGGGVVLYLDQEGRGLGIVNKLRAYMLQDYGLDTVDANTTLGYEDDERDYGKAGRMLELLGCRRVLLLTNNPGKLDGLAGTGVEICGRVPLQAPLTADNARYLTAKAMRAGHWLDDALNPTGVVSVRD
jgi:GTP cyclohydrolase II